MAAYLAMRIMAGKLDYVTIFSSPTYAQFKQDTDDILIAEGQQDLIKEIPA